MLAAVPFLTPGAFVCEGVPWSSYVGHQQGRGVGAGKRTGKGGTGSMAQGRGLNGEWNEIWAFECDSGVMKRR